MQLDPSQETWNVLDSERLENRLSEQKEPYGDLEATTEANRCINCYQAPCIHACPTSINIPQFISRIGNDDAIGAAKTILDSNILGHSCAVSCPTEVLCEGACVYHSLHQEPIHIGKLQRYAVAQAYEQKANFYEPGPSTGKRVALIGAGPASLACAHELRKMGHDAHIYEKAEIPGGLNTLGIAPYKMKARTSLWEIQQIAKIGMDFHFGKELGRNLHLNELLQEYDAVFLGMGLGPDSRIDIPGINHSCVQGAVEFIAKIKILPASEMKWLGKVQTALVIGAGNTALDACRELKALGIPRVIVSYRRGEKDMSGYSHERLLARQQGVEFWFNTLPTEISEKGHSQVVCKLQKTDHSQEFLELPVDLVLLATGQSKLENLLSNIPNLRLESGKLQVDPQTGKTGHPKIFAGGDIVNGGMEVVNAVAEGKRAALGIHQEFIHG